MFMFSVGWQASDITQTNCVKFLTSLAPHCYLKNMFDADKVAVTYKLNCIFGFTG